MPERQLNLGIPPSDWFKEMYPEGTISLQYEATLPVKLIEDFDGFYAGCVHLVDRKCTNYENRPRICSEFNCFNFFNRGGGGVQTEFPFAPLELVKMMVDDVHQINLEIPEENA
jgi:Fe-S-cluster containining protein